MAQYSLGETPVEDQIQLGDTMVPPPSSLIAQSRAAKADMGLSGITGQDYDSIYKQISDGQEDTFRTDASARLDYKAYQNRQQALTQLAAQKGRMLSLDEVQQTLTGKPTNPDTVIEQSYAQNYVQQLQEAAKRIDDNILSDAQLQDPDAVNRYFNHGSDILSRLEYARTKAQNNESKVRDDAWFNIPFFDTPWTPDGKIPMGSRTAPVSTLLNWGSLGIYGGLREEYLTRGNTPETSRFAGILRGNNIREQALELLHQPSFDKFKELFDAGFNRLNDQNPALAQEWAQGVAGMSTDDMIVKDVMSGMNILGGTLLAKAFKEVATGFGRGGAAAAGSRATPPGGPTGPAEGLVKGADGVYRPASQTVQQTAQAIEDVLKSSPASPTKANVAEAVGDGKEAGVQKAIQTFQTFDPKKEATDTLMDLHKVQQADIAASPGGISREVHTRLIDAGETYEKALTDVIQNTTNVVRLPALAENGFRDVADRVSDYFRGKENTIVNVDMIHDPVTNTEHHVVTLGNYDGAPFSSLKQAENHATINGYGKPKFVGNEPDTVYLPKISVLKQTFPTETTSKWEPNPDFHIMEKDGRTTFHLGDAEVIPSLKPEPTHIPYNLQTKKFGQPLAYGPHIIQKGLGFHIKWIVPLDETQDFIRDGLIVPGRTTSATSETNRFTTAANGLLGYLRSPSDTLSLAENENRAKVVYTQNRFLSLMQQEMKYVEKLYHGLLDDGNVVKRKSLSYVGNLTGRNKQVWNEFVRALKVAQKYPDPDTGLPGYYFKTPAQIQDFWQRTFGRPASEPEMQAYLAVSRINHADLVFRSIAQYKNKSRLGVMEHVLTSMKDGQKVKSAPFEGRFLNTKVEGKPNKAKVPQGDKVVVIHDGQGFKLLNVQNVDFKKDFESKVAQGRYRGIQLYDPDKYPVKIYDKDGNPIRVVYVFSNSVESSPIGYKQIEYRGGGHWDYAYERYIKQPIIRKESVGGKVRTIYVGDNTFSPIKENDTYFLGKLNEVRRHLSQKNPAQAKTVHLSYSDQPWKDFVKNFYPRKNRTTGEIDPPRFNLDEDFRIVPRGMTTLDIDRNLETKYAKRGKFVDATRSDSLARNFQVEFTGARDSYDLFEPKREGSVSNPRYKFEPAELTDPIVAMTRAMDRIVNSLYMDDYKISAVEHWLQENMDLMAESDKKRVRASPFNYFMNEPLSRAGKNSLRGQIAESNRYKIKKLLGTPTYFDTQMHTMKQYLADWYFETNSKATKAALVVPSWMLQNIHSGPNFVRGMAFHENLGLFNWMQLAAQNVAYINFAALSPAHAYQGAMGAWLHLMSLNNGRIPIIHYLGQLAEKLPNGWKPGEWEEARRHYESSGFGKIGNTLAIDNGNYKQNYLLSAGKQLLRNGTIFFDLAEQNVRHGAWYTAYHEFQRAYPNQKIGDVEIGKIMRRANDLYMNMGRDSKTLLNTGLTSMTLQFFKYIENVGQLFLSKRIGDEFGRENTWKLRAQKRAQMILMYSLAFGPLGATGLSLLPVNDIVRQKALEWGYVPGDNALTTLLMEGPLSMAGAYASGWWRSGKLDMHQGTFYNYNNRYGANGYQLIRDLLEPSSTYWKVLLGASGTSLANTLGSLSPFTYALKSAYNDEQDNPFRLTIDDWKEGLRNINSFRYAERLIYAIEFGKWLDRHGRPTEDVGKIDAIFRTLLGTNDQKLDDTYLMSQTKQSEKENYATAAQDYQHYRRLAEQEAANGNDSQATAYNKNAFFVLASRGVPPEEVAKIFQQDAQLNKNTLDKNVESYYLKLVPTYRQEAARKALQTILQNRPGQ